MLMPESIESIFTSICSYMAIKNMLGESQDVLLGPPIKLLLILTFHDNIYDLFYIRSEAVTFEQSIHFLITDSHNHVDR